MSSVANVQNKSLIVLAGLIGGGLLIKAIYNGLTKKYQSPTILSKNNE
jgi:hypothetical protein